MGTAQYAGPSDNSPYIGGMSRPLIGDAKVDVDGPIIYAIHIIWIPFSSQAFLSLDSGQGFLRILC